MDHLNPCPQKENSKLNHQKISTLCEELNRNESFTSALQQFIYEVPVPIDFDEIQLKFPEEMTKFQHLFQILDSSQNSDERRQGFEIVRKIFKIEDSCRLAPLREKLTNVAVSEVIQKIRWFSKPKDLEPIFKNLEEIKQFEEKWRPKTQSQVKMWAQEVRKSGLGANFCEAIAVMNRGLHLIKNYHLRQVQIVPILVLLQDRQSGLLCEIQPEEDKVVIAAFLAVIKVLQGQKVDVVTRNRNPKEMEEFYKIMGVKMEVTTPKVEDLEEEYQADILYGTMINFQVHYLHDTFTEFKVRHARPFGHLILDEIDDGHLAHLSEPCPEMKILKYVYIKIWQELINVEAEIQKELEEKFNTEILTKEDFWASGWAYIEEVGKDLKPRLIDRIKSGNPTDLPMLKGFLKKYADHKLESWISSAIRVRDTIQENVHYKIEAEIVVPIGNTTTWQNGLTQFVQLKHNLCLTVEDLNMCSISSIEYLKLFEPKNISGMTSSMGSETQQNLFLEIYGMDSVQMPAFGPSALVEHPGVVVEDTEWSRKVIQLTLAAKGGVVVICQTEKDLRELAQILENLTKNLRIFHKSQDPKPVKSEDVLLTTIQACRGTRFKSNEEKGIHVVVAFLPVSSRVEKQCFGRIQRGSVQLVVRSSEVSRLGLSSQDDFQRIKEARDASESRHNFQFDPRNRKFADLYRNLAENRTTPEDQIVLRDLKQLWGFWKETKVEFEDFKALAGSIIHKNKIVYNPYNHVTLAEYFLDCGMPREARTALENVREELLVEFHLSFFQIATFEVAQNPGEYRTGAVEHLKLAKTMISVETGYIEENFINNNSCFGRILVQRQNNSFLLQLFSHLGRLRILDEMVTEMLEVLEEDSTLEQQFERLNAIYKVAASKMGAANKVTGRSITAIVSSVTMAWKTVRWGYKLVKGTYQSYKRVKEALSGLRTAAVGCRSSDHSDQLLAETWKLSQVVQLGREEEKLRAPSSLFHFFCRLLYPTRAAEGRLYRAVADLGGWLLFSQLITRIGRMVTKMVEAAGAGLVEKGCSLGEVDKVVESFIKNEKAFQLLKTIGLQLVNIFKNKGASFGEVQKIGEFQEYVCLYVEYINENVQQSDFDNKATEIFELICRKLLDQMELLYSDMIKGCVIGLKMESWWSLEVVLKDLEGMRDPFKVLDLREGAPVEEIEQRWLEMVLVLHPGCNKHDPLVEQKFALVRSAYESLKKPVK